MESEFRKDIQGLRAIAVISIFFYHLNLLNGGFLGVDIFFVISGYVITKSILTNKKKLTFNNYIFKRLKRLFIPLFFLILLTFLIVTIIFIPHHIDHFSKSSFYSILFVSNFYFWQNTNHYFDLDKTLQPLLHTWSLGVEMQFYIIFGLIIFAFNHKKLLFILIFLFFISLIVSEANAEREMSFWLMPFRLFEFIIGSFVFLLPKKKINIFYETILSFLCLSFILAALFFFNENYKFPGINALYICLVTGLLIYLNNENLIYKTLSSSLANYVGKVSYSLYLVHWPVIVLFLYFNPAGLLFFDYILIFIISIILSIIFHKYFENFDFSKFKLNTKFNFSLFIIFATILTFILSMDFIKNLNFKYYSENSKKLLELKNLAATQRGFYLEENTIIYEGSKRKLFNLDINKKNILIIGDSHSEDLFAGFLQTVNSEYNIYWQHLPLECNKTILLKPDWHITEKILFYIIDRKPWTQIFYEMCSKYYQDLENSNNLKNLDYVLISMKWNDEEIEYIKQFSDFFIKNSNAEIIFLSKRIQIPDIERSIIVNENFDELNLFLNKYKKTYIKFNNNFKNKVNEIDENLIFYDLNKFICEKETCNFIKDGKFNYIDYSHFSLDGSKEIIKKFFKSYFEK